MSKKLTLIIAVLEAAVLLIMKFTDWHESKKQKPRAGKVARAGKHRVVNPSPPEYHGESPEGERSATNILASGGTADEEIHEKD